MIFPVWTGGRKKNEQSPYGFRAGIFRCVREVFRELSECSGSVMLAEIFQNEYVRGGGSMNFTFQRNPGRLLELCGMDPVRNREREKRFMEKAAALDPSELRPLVLVVGGFLDQFLGNSYAVSERYPADLRARHDVWFREHYESRRMCELVKLYASRGHSIALIGHSWGGDAVVNLVARKMDVPIDLLISLDPVSRKGAPRKPLPNVGYWLNVHIDYARTTWADISNLVARIGGPWGDAGHADHNISCPPDMTHGWAWGMFERCAEPVLRECAVNWR